MTKISAAYTSIICAISEIAFAKWHIEKNIKNKKGENMNEIGYKVVKVNDENKLVSSSVGTGIHIYGLGMVTEPRFGHGPLTVFTKPHKAIGFIGDMKSDNMRRARLFKCEYEVCTKVIKPFRIVDGLPEVMRDEMPKGSVLARKVKLLEEIALPEAC